MARGPRRSLTPVPRKPVYTGQKCAVLVVSEDDAVYLVRLLTFVPGETVGTVPYTSKLIYQLGQTLASVNNALQVLSECVSPRSRSYHKNPKIVQICAKNPKVRVSRTPFKTAQFKLLGSEKC